MPPKAKTFAKSFASIPPSLKNRIAFEAGKNIIQEQRPSTTSVPKSGYGPTAPMYIQGIGVIEGPATYVHTKAEQSLILDDALDYVHRKYYTGKYNAALTSKKISSDMPPMVKAKPKARPVTRG